MEKEHGLISTKGLGSLKFLVFDSDANVMTEAL